MPKKSLVDGLIKKSAKVKKGNEIAQEKSLGKVWPKKVKVKALGPIIKQPKQGFHGDFTQIKKRR